MEFNKNFWKAYGLTVVQLIVTLLVIFSAYALIILSLSSTYPFMQVLENMQQSGSIDVFADQFIENQHLFSSFLISLIAIVLSYTIILSGVLSLFDYIILNKLQKTNFQIFVWMKEWFRYSSISLLLLILAYILVSFIDNIDILFIALYVLIFVFSYIILIMQSGQNIFYAIRKTIIRSLVIFFIYIVIFLFSVLLLSLEWIGLLISFLLFSFVVLWSKVYILKKIIKIF